jgi:hypothetical protein
MQGHAEKCYRFTKSSLIEISFFCGSAGDMQQKTRRRLFGGERIDQNMFLFPA